jgi:hypothetical protein
MRKQTKYSNIVMPEVDDFQTTSGQNGFMIAPTAIINGIG